MSGGCVSAGRVCECGRVCEWRVCECGEGVYVVCAVVEEVVSSLVCADIDFLS